jgi:hypothetical protein
VEVGVDAKPQNERCSTAMLASRPFLHHRLVAIGGLVLATLCSATPAMAMDQCRPGSGQVDRWPFFAGVGLTIVLVVFYSAFLRIKPNQPPRHRARLAVILLALFSSCGACSTITCGVMFCPRNTQLPATVCDHLAEIASESKQPVGFDHTACLASWRQEQEDLSSWSYRELSGCVRGIDFVVPGACEAEGFEPARHAPGQWPPPTE